MVLCAATRLMTKDVAGTKNQINELQEEFELSDERVAHLRRCASKILQKPHIKWSIVRVSAELVTATDGIVQAKKIREIYEVAES